MMTHYSVMTSSLRIKNLKIDNFDDFSSGIDFSSKSDIFRDVISLIINQCDPQAPKGRFRQTQCLPAEQRKQAKRGVHTYKPEVMEFLKKINDTHLKGLASSRNSS